MVGFFLSYLFIFVTCLVILQSSSDSGENLVKKLTNYMKEKDRALQVNQLSNAFFI